MERGEGERKGERGRKGESACIIEGEFVYGNLTGVWFSKRKREREKKKEEEEEKKFVSG